MPLTPSEALTRWKSAQNRLWDAILEYTDACNVLERSLHEHNSDDGVLSDLDTLLPGLSRHEDALRVARLGLAKTRNPTHAVTPIHKLHPDLLTLIFTLATQQWMSKDFEILRDQPASVTTLASVCSSWRRLLLQLPVFWSNLGIVLTGPASEKSYERAALWAKRAQSAPLWLSVFDTTVGRDETGRRPSHQVVSESALAKMTQSCAPLMPFVRTLAIHIEDAMPTAIVHSLLGCWIRHGPLDVAERFELHAELHIPQLQIPVISPGYQGSDLPPSDVAPFLRSLRGIYLENVIIDFGQVPYSGLTSLHIEFSSQTSWLPTEQDLVRLFTANPGLRSLTLEGVSLGPDERIQSPIALDCLEQMRLEAPQDRDLGRVLSLISSSSPAIGMAITIGDDNGFECISAAQSFFSRTNVTVLFVDCAGESRDGGEPALAALFASMPHLHTLILQSCDISVPVLEQFAQWRASRHGLENPWPALRTLHLCQCQTRPDIIRRLVQIQSFETLGLFEPQVWTVHSVWSSAWANTNARAGIEQELLQKGIKVVWYSPAGTDLPSWTFMP
ncbi:F-box-like domain-containing protein [Ceratobasidium sp. AG-Ba]|nr:F-box-like domain-containing protein [Ceratobasidium sp. AG-Ba]QRW11632.1 F-box-like domain-containing protein [Ceratobasidium sp. AG-Ba]